MGPILNHAQVLGLGLAISRGDDFLVLQPCRQGSEVLVESLVSGVKCIPLLGGVGQLRGLLLDESLRIGEPGLGEGLRLLGACHCSKLGFCVDSVGSTFFLTRGALSV